MSEAVLEHTPVQEKAPQEKYTINHLARDIAKRNPEYGSGEDAKFPIFKEGKFGSDLREDINDENFIRWMRQEIYLWYGIQEWAKNDGSQSNKISRLFRRFMPPRHTQLSDQDLEALEGNIDDVMNYVEKNEDDEHNINFKRLLEAKNKK